MLKRWVLCLIICLSACAKRDMKVANYETFSFKGLAYVVAERGNTKWASNVSVLVKMPGSLRLDALEKISDVTAVLAVKDGGGFLTMPLEDKWYQVKNGKVRLPKIGEMPITGDELAGILTGRPHVEGGTTVSELFHTDRGSYFIKGPDSEMEMSSVEKMPLVYTKYSSSDKKKIVYEVDFDDFTAVGGKKMPRHIILRFEHPRLVMEIKYKDMHPDARIHPALFEVKPSKE